MTPSELLAAWLQMLTTAASGNRNGFRDAQSLFARFYKRADYAVQGEFHRLLAEDHKRAMA